MTTTERERLQAELNQLAIAIPRHDQEIRDHEQELLRLRALVEEECKRRDEILAMKD